MEVQQERRKFKRLPLEFPVQMKVAHLPPEQSFEGALSNLTIQGAAVDSLAVTQPGDAVNLSFVLQPELHCEVTAARVIYCRQVTAERYLSGVHFIDFRQGDFEKLDRYLKLLKLLQGTVLFKRLTLTELRRLLSIATEERYSEGKGIFAEGLKALALYIVVSGAVKISKRNSRGVEEPLAIIREGEVFGEMALLDDYPRTATASAHRDTLVLRIDSEHFKRLMSDQGELANKLLWIFIQVLCRRLREADKQIVEMFSSTTSVMKDPSLH